MRQILSITCLGATRVQAGPISLRLTAERAATIAVLVAAGPEGLTRKRLYRELFERDPQASGEQAAVMRVRRLNEKMAELTDGTPPLTVLERFAFSRDQCMIDVWEFERNARSSDPEVLARALRSWGEPFADVELDIPIVTEARAGLHRMFREALIRFGWMITPGFGADLISVMEREITEDPFNEPLVAGAAAALFRLGQQIRALELIGRCRTSLLNEFGLSPGPHLDEIEFAILSQNGERLSARRPAAAGSGSGRRETEETVEEIAVESRFVGRDDLMARLTADIAAMTAADQRSPGRIHVLVGAAGMGKSTLVRHVLSGIDRAEFDIRIGRSRGGPGRRLAEVPDDLEVYRPVVEALPDLRPALAELELTVDDREQARLRFWQTVHERLQALAADRPTIIALEDLHDADSQTLALLHYLVRATRPARLMFILTSRDESRDESRDDQPAPGIAAEAPVAGRLADLFGAPSVTTSRIDPFTLDEIRRLVEFDHPDQPVVVRERFAQGLWERSKGNALVASVLSRDAGDDLDPMRLPDQLRPEESLSSHLGSKVPDLELRQLLGLAALLAGPDLEFSEDRLIHLTPLDEIGLGALLTIAADAQICRPVGDRIWAFDHVVTVGVFAGEVGAFRSVVATQLLQLPGLKPSDRVRHALAAGSLLSPPDTVAILLTAAEELEQRLAFQEARIALGHVLATIDDEAGASIAVPVRRIEVMTRLAACCSRVGDLAAAAGYRRQAFAVAEAEGDHNAMCDIALSGLPSGEYAGGEPDRLEMLDRVDPDRISPDRDVGFHRWRLRLARICGRPDLAELAVADIERRPRPTWDREAQAEVAVERLFFEADSSGRTVYDELAGLIDDTPSGPVRAEVTLRAVVAALVEQRPDAITKDYPLAAAQARVAGSPRTRWSLDVLSVALGQVGALGAEEWSADPATTRLSGLNWGIPDVYDAWGVQTWAGLWFSGRFAEALAMLDRTRDAIFTNVAWTAAEALAWAKTGSRDRAAEACREVENKIGAERSVTWLPTAAALLAETAYEVGDPGAAKVAESVLSRRSGQAIVLGVGSVHLGPVDRYLGLTATLTGSDNPRRLLTAAQQQAEDAGIMLWSNRSTADLERLEF